MIRPRALTRRALALLYAVAGVLHLTMPAPFLTIIPAFVPAPERVVQLTGWAELAGAAALLQGWSPVLRQAGAWGLAAYALCVWPANISHMAMDLADGDGGLPLAYHIPRLLAQPVLIWAALWAGGITDWPWRRR